MLLFFYFNIYLLYMRLIIILLLILVIVYLVRKGLRENFKNLNVLEYPDTEIEVHDKWIRYHANDTLLKKRKIIKYVNLLENEINLLFYSKKYDEIMMVHANKLFEDKMPYIISIFQKFLRRFTNNETNEEIIEINIGNDKERVSTLIAYSDLGEILIKYLECNLRDIDDDEEGRTGCGFYRDLKTEQKHFEFNKLKTYKIVNNLFLIHKYITNREINTLTRLLYKILEKYYIFNSPEFKSDEYLPCVIYDENTCKLASKKCEYDSDSNICLPKENNDTRFKYKYNNPIQNCNVISKYGKKYCNRTYNLDGNLCRYQDKTSKCMNPNEDISEENIKCEDVNHNGNGSNFETYCKSLKDKENNSRCNYEEITKDGDIYKYCIDKSEETNPKNPMTCLNFTSVLEDGDILTKYGCEILQHDDVNYTYNPKLMTKSQIKNLDCGIFDNSNYIRNATNTDFLKKRSNQKYRVHNTDKQEELCQSLGGQDSRKCRFIRHNLYNNEEITKCLPRNIQVSSNIINQDDDDESTKESRCKVLGYKYLGEEEEKKKCIDVEAKCNDIKYKSVCEERDNKCFWNPGINDYSDYSNDTFERGYCMNLDFVGLEQVIDNFHESEIEKLAKFQNLNTQFDNLNTDNEIGKRLKNKFDNKVLNLDNIANTQNNLTTQS